ncbi:guanylate kinase-related [Holotrichia oblita]|nr:guanylate kinase-related [Holotrichia oblita]
MKQGLLIIISGPSGAGKGTIYNAVLERMPNIKKSISVTTRSPRPHEQEGVHYYFKTVEQYQQMIADGEFLETASVYSNHYGTPKAAVYETLKKGNDVMFEIDINGARQIKKKYANCVSIYIMTPTFEILEQRLRDRNTETEDSIKRRLGSAKSELSQYSLFDYIVFNDDVETSVKKVINIIEAEKCRIKNNESQIQELLK